jgi:hypothetical protein
MIVTAQPVRDANPAAGALVRNLGVIINEE